MRQQVVDVGDAAGDRVLDGNDGEIGALLLDGSAAFGDMMARIDREGVVVDR